MLMDKQKEIERKELAKGQKEVPVGAEGLGWLRRVGSFVQTAWHKLFLPQVASQNLSTQDKVTLFA